MANVRLTFLQLLQIILLSYTYCCASDFNENLDEFYRPQIHALVRYLNQDSSRVYNYNYATLISAQKESDSIDLTVDIELECRIPDLCTTDKLTCQGTVRYNPESASYETLPGVSCQPKLRIDLSRDELIPEEIDGHRLEYTPTEEVQEEIIKKDHVSCAGCAVDVETDAEGVDVLADVGLKHIESERENKLVVLKVLNVQRQIVAGVKYTLLLEVANTFCPKTVEPEYVEACVPDKNTPSEICEVTYFQQPWLNKIKHIIANNCTHAQEFSMDVPVSKDKSNEMNNEVDANYNYAKVGPVDMGGIMSSARMREIESQVVYKPPKPERPLESAPKQEDTVEPAITSTESHLTDAQKSAIDDFLDMMGDEPRMKRSTKNNKNDDDSSSSSSSSEENGDDNNNHDDKKKIKHKKEKDDDDDDDDNNNNNKDDSSSSSSSSSEEDNNNNDDDDNNDDKKKKHKKRSRRNIEPNNTSESNETKEDKTLKNKKSSESSEENQKVTNDAPELNKQNDEHILKKRSLDYSLTKITPDEKILTHNLANIAVSELDNLDSDNHKRIVLQVLGAKKMYDNGYIYHITMRVGVSTCPEKFTEIIDLNEPVQVDRCRDSLYENLTKICKVQIHVDEEKKNPKILKSHCQDIKKDVSVYTHKSERGNRTHRDKRGGLPGGVNKKDPKAPENQKYVTEFLQQLNAHKGLTKKQEIIEIQSYSTQVVAGIKHTFTVKIKEGGQTRTCTYVVWQRAWMNPANEVTETCDDQSKNKYRFRRSTQHLLGKDDHDIHIGLFKNFMQKYNKKYEDRSEYKRRYKIFRENMKKVHFLNKNEQGTAKYGATIFADLTEKEFQQYKGLDLSLRNTNHIPVPQAQIPDIEIPVEFDWRKKGVVSEVKNQGSCGSCWAFSVTGNIESLNAIKTGNMIELSEQELLDCDTMDNGCGGGYMDNAYRAIEKLGGLETETDYPYEAENEKCSFNASLSRVGISGAVNISSDEKEIAKWLVKNGPISIGINANAMQFYMGGISHPFKFLCNPKSIDHGVLLVGYGVHKYPLFNKTLPFWIVKNSWGPTWGEAGYYRVYRGDGTCGVNTMCESAIL